MLLYLLQQVYCAFEFLVLVGCAFALLDQLLLAVFGTLLGPSLDLLVPLEH